MKTITSKIITTVVFTLLLSTRLWAQTDNGEQLNVALSDPGKPFALNIDLVQGSINVVGYEGKDIQINIQAPGEERHRNRETSNGMKRLGPSGAADIKAEEKNNKVTISEGIPTHVALTIKVPQNGGTIKISTINNGMLTVSNVNAEMEISNTNGSIKLTNVSGSVVANTLNGNVWVSFKSVDPKAPMAFTSLNGNVDVTFPSSLKANVKIKTDRGDIYTDFDVMNDGRKPEVTRTAKDGMYSLKIDDWVYGKIDGGGPELMMKTMNGNIYVRKAK